MSLRIPDPGTIFSVPCATCGAEIGKRCKRPSAPKGVRLTDARAWCLDRLDAATRRRSKDHGEFIDRQGRLG